MAGLVFMLGSQGFHDTLMIQCYEKAGRDGRYRYLLICMRNDDDGSGSGSASSLFQDPRAQTTPRPSHQCYATTITSSIRMSRISKPLLFTIPLLCHLVNFVP